MPIISKETKDYIPPKAEILIAKKKIKPLEKDLSCQ